MFEVDVNISEEELNHIESFPGMWLYRVQVSMEGVRQQLYEAGNSDDNKERYKVLQLFLEQVNVWFVLNIF